jgi:3-deoxy-D-arabino-heptulosonate 7-phosphate (DAHP) synthase class II
LPLVVNPDNIPGKVTLISRYGADKIEKFLPAHIEAVKATRHIVVWQCDAMVSLGVVNCVRQVTKTQCIRYSTESTSNN